MKAKDNIYTEIVAKAEVYLANKGYGSGTNYTTNNVAWVMALFAKKYHKQKMAEIMPGDEEIKIEAQKYWQHSTGLLSTWFEKGAKWYKSLLTQEEK